MIGAEPEFAISRRGCSSSPLQPIAKNIKFINIGGT
jgi:hypothetical protein